MTPEVYFHLGLHRTATTLLQERVFPFLRGIEYLPRSDPRVSRLMRSLVHKDPLAFDASAVRRGFLSLIRGDRAVFSSEDLSGMPYRGYVNRSAILDNLSHAFPHARILIGIRNQADLIWSLYRFYVRRGGRLRLRDLLNGDGAQFLDPDSFRYGPYLRRMTELFGRDNIHVCVFENLVTDPEAFLDEIYRFVGSESIQPVNTQRINVGVIDRALPLYRFFSLFFRTTLGRGILPAPPSLWNLVNRLSKYLPTAPQSKERSVLVDLPRFGEDNAAADHALGLGLQKSERLRRKYGIQDS